MLLLAKLLLTSPSVHDVRFDVGDLTPVEQPALRQERSWLTPTLDAVTLRRLPGTAQHVLGQSVEDVERQLQLEGRLKGFELESVEHATVAGSPAIRALFRVPHDTGDMSYAATLVFAVDERAFELVVVAPDHDVTGLRGVLVTTALLKDGHRPGQAEDGSYAFPAWESPQGRALAALVDDPRARRDQTLAGIEGSMELGPAPRSARR
ncbi:MAG: hypothetical protein H6741_10690 [Alphaproteobacteria bacterium]|nr:hypothetical protein [Alphaproteobacteria bacterium]